MVAYYSQLLTGPHVPEFERAIRNAVRPDDVVVDLGCGVGTYAMLAARAGAKRVFGVELDAVVGFARQIAERNGVNVEFVAADARDVELPERATLLIFEDYSTDLLGGQEGNLLQLVRERWMTDNCRILPYGATLNVAPVSSQWARQEAFPLEKEDATWLNLDVKPLIDAAQNSLHRLQSPTDLKLLSQPNAVLEQDFAEPFPERWSTETSFDFDAGADLDGICLWHDLLLDENTTFSNGPETPSIWGQYLIATPERWQVAAGDRLDVKLSFRSGLDDGFWRWSFVLHRATGNGERFSGNTFAGTPLTAEGLAQHRTDEVVQLTDRAKLEALILSLVDGKRTVQEIADEVQTRSGMRGAGEALELVLSHLENRKAV